MWEKETKPEFYTLYSITCTQNNKTYIGVCLWWKQRRCKHIYDLKLGIHGNHGLQEDFNKYGLNSICFDIVATYAKKEEALLIEKYYTDVVFCKNKEICYNILSGGSNVAEQMRERFQTKIRTDIEFKNKIAQNTSLRFKGRIILESTKIKIREKAIGRKASDETKSKFSEQRKRGGNGKAKRVIDENTGKIYDCLKDAAEGIGVNYDMVRARINGYNKQTTTLKWLH